jgi:hypothetical protein
MDMNIYSRLRHYLERRSAQNFLEGIYPWHQTCREVSQLCSEALNDKDVLRGDIGVILDKMDRNLFALRNHIGDSKGFLKRQNRALTRRFTKVNKDVYQMRNHTAKFLIRGQGPGPFPRDQEMEEERWRKYYDRALIDIGIGARRMNEGVSEEIEAIWSEMQKLIRQAEETIAD